MPAMRDSTATPQYGEGVHGGETALAHLSFTATVDLIVAKKNAHFHFSRTSQEHSQRYGGG